MSLRIPDNLMNRPRSPGGESDGGESVTRNFGNRVEQGAALPSTPVGWGGVANPAAGVEGQALARAAETIGNSINDVNSYYNGLRTAEEDSRAKLMYLEIDKKDAETRSRLDADPEYAKLGTTEQQSRYEIERDIEIDKVRNEYGFTQKTIIRNVDQNLQQYKSRSSADYMERVVKPRVVAQNQIRDGKSDDLVIDKIIVEPTAENVAVAAANIVERYTSPQAYATYGALKAEQMKGAAIGKLTSAALNGGLEKLDVSPLAKLSGPAITSENLAEGEIGALVANEKGRMEVLIGQMPITEAEKLVLKNKADKYIDQFAKASVSDHNKQVKEAEAAQKEAIQSTVDTFQVSLSLQARNGGLNGKQLLGQFTKLAESPDFKDNPAALKRLYVAYDRVDAERVGYEREQRRLASDRKTRETIAEMRMENGIAVSSSAADQVWKKNGTLKSFIDGGNVVGAAHLQEIAKAGAVPTSVLGSIQNDIRSQNPQIQARGIANLRAIKSYSSQTQNALYRDLPDDFAGVINRLESGQTPSEALQFLTRQKNTPDVEKKLKQDASSKINRGVADSVLKDVNLSPQNMSTSVRDKLDDQWQESFARAGGDVKLARELFKQDVVKNRELKVSDFSGKVEMYPTSRFADKKTITSIINDDFPETKGKDVVPVFSGLKRVGNEEVPTYDIYIREDGVMTRITTENKQFYTSHEEAAARYNANKAVDAAAPGLDQKAQTQATIDALSTREKALREKNARLAAQKAARTQGN